MPQADHNRADLTAALLQQRRTLRREMARIDRAIAEAQQQVSTVETRITELLRVGTRAA